MLCQINLFITRKTLKPLGGLEPHLQITSSVALPIDLESGTILSYNGIKVGWSNWIRTNTEGVKVPCSTIKLCSKKPWMGLITLLRCHSNCPITLSVEPIKYEHQKIA